MLRILLVLMLAWRPGMAAGSSARHRRWIRNDYASRANWLCLPDPGRATPAMSISAPPRSRRTARRGCCHSKRRRIRRSIVSTSYPTSRAIQDRWRRCRSNGQRRWSSSCLVRPCAAVCRPFAPVYRRVPVRLRRPTDRGSSATRWIRARSTPGRALSGHARRLRNYYRPTTTRRVVLIGHSQGSGVLSQLIAKEIDGSEQARLVSAILMGTVLTVPKGPTSAATSSTCRCACAGPDRLRHRLRLVPRHHPAAAGFVVRPAGGSERHARRRLRQPGQPRAGGGVAEELSRFRGVDDHRSFSISPKSWVEGETVTTPFVTVPGLLRRPLRHDRAVPPTSPSASTATRADRGPKTSSAMSSSSAASPCQAGACT